MIIKSNLFSKGHPVSAEARLSDILDIHKKQVIAKIKAVTSLKDMTDTFLTELVKEALVEPLAIIFDKATREFRNDTIETPRGSYKANVARLSIPFVGDPLLLKYAPKTCSLTFPIGEVRGNKIQFDVIMTGDHNAEQVKQEVRQNHEKILNAALSNNEQVREFNESLPEAVRTAFASKFDDLKKQHAIFDDLGIKELDELVEPPAPASSTAPKAKVSKPTYIYQYVENQFVQQLSQFNRNTGDVNNAIQSS